jgi:hypothetical protein
MLYLTSALAISLVILELLEPERSFCEGVEISSLFP